ncbi:succinate--CoA ligase [GDP-forming] subunit beta, mitochondrial isoform X1 [Schistocerca americana]|uniref:succinate--CoA ligase [GDP-forming] subunit beta, mitochondrial isoform X1 n=2 Tax=Schistocerca americana TaxID=7009 RepID=UPI001F4F4FCB|nr:succinate--CoA ligase [GDP-forming] subunit beta, mitochondrial isoform X1 [Schistocerca americana]
MEKAVSREGAMAAAQKMLNLPCSFTYFARMISTTQQRCLNLMEYQSKVLLQNSGVTVQNFLMAENPADAVDISKKLKVPEYVIKAQVLAGGRGLGHFDNGFKSGVHITKKPAEIEAILGNMIGHRLITKQTPKDGILVKKVMVAESVTIKRETYVCILMDREHNGPVIVASPSGGTDIENVAEKTPHLIKTVPVNISEGVSDEMANTIAKFLGFEGAKVNKAATEIKRLWDFFLKVDAIQVEINPLAETVEGNVVAVDAKIQFDDNAKFRQQDIFALDNTSETDPREVQAAKYNLNYIGMSGNIGCLVNGAGLAMATMDIIKLHGGEPANFLDVGGGVREEQVYEAFKILTSDPNVKAILVNVFGGIVNCATIANGIVNASRNIKLSIPLVVRLEGTNVEEAKKILKESGLPIQLASSLEDAAVKVTSSI